MQKWILLNASIQSTCKKFFLIVLVAMQQIFFWANFGNESNTTRMLKNKKFKQKIGIAEKSQKKKGSLW